MYLTFADFAKLNIAKASTLQFAEKVTRALEHPPLLPQWTAQLDRVVLSRDKPTTLMRGPQGDEGRNGDVLHFSRTLQYLRKSLWFLQRVPPHKVVQADQIPRLYLYHPALHSTLPVPGPRSDT